MSDAPGPYIDPSAFADNAVFAGLPAPDTPAFAALLAFCDQHRDEALAALPWAVAQIAESCGFAAMLQLVQRHGGRRIYLPRGRDACAARLGLETLDPALHRRLLDRASAAGTIEIPSAWGVFVALRRVAIRAALHAGDTPQRLAQSFGIDERELRREADALPAQADAAPDPN